MTETLKQLDAYLGYFIKKLMEAELYFNSNIILTSDHGMTDIHKNQTVIIEDYVKSWKPYYFKL